MADSKIEWTDKVWNPTTGCTLACTYCYAEKMAHRLQAMGQHKYRQGFTPACHPGELVKPVRWKKPCRVFVNSMGDLFDPAIPEEFINKVVTTISLFPEHTFQVLTKQPHRMQKYFSAHQCPTNLWVGVTIENQAAADTRLPHLLKIKAAVRFVSIEPMIGPIDLAPGWGHLGTGPIDGLNWVICGGMTGKDAVPMHPDWVRTLRDQCKAAEVPFFFKGWGEWLPTASANYASEKGWVYGKTEGRAILRDGRHVYLDLGPAARFKTIDVAAAQDLKLAMDKNEIDPLDPDKYDWLGYQWMHRFGKKDAGSMIDGQEWKQFPEGK